MYSFSDGYDLFLMYSGGATGALTGNQYVDSVQSAINELVDSLNRFEGTGVASAQLKGNVAEFWQSGTFNISATLNGSSHRTSVPSSNEYASGDILTNWGDKTNIGLKYYSNGAESAKQQSKSIFEKYMEYKSADGKDTLDAYLAKRGYSNDTVINDPVYGGQIRLIPKDQIFEATEWLKRRIAENSMNRPEQVSRYRETLSKLTDRIHDDHGNSSIPLSKSEAEEIARIAKEGKLSAEEFGLTPEELIQVQHLIQQSLRAGLTSATITAVLKVVPEVIKAISYLVRSGEIDESTMRRIGGAAIKGASEGFVKGTIAAALTASCKSGLLGESAKSINPSIIGAVTVIAFDTMVNAIDVAYGKKTRYMLTAELTKEMYVSAWMLGGGALTQAVIGVPILGYMLGSFAGSVVGAFTYEIGNSLALSFFVETGFTIFGLVEQNYELPSDVLEEIGIDVFEYETFDWNEFEYNHFEPKAFQVNHFVNDNIEIVFLRRGVIGVSKIGYIV